MNTFKPMLAATVDNIMKLSYPLYASPKLDGIRAVVIDGVLMSRNLKAIPNAYVQSLFGKTKYNGLDGELICGDPCSATCFRDTSSAVMGREGKPDVKFHVFDLMNNPEFTYATRHTSLNRLVQRTGRPELVMVPHVQVMNSKVLTGLEEDWLAAGYEGLMINADYAPYKFGRSTLKEGYLLKLKRFLDGEAEVIGWEEQQHNGNEATKDNLGRTKRSTHAAGKSGTGKLGALVVRDLVTGVEFNVGSGFTDEERVRIWNSMMSANTHADGSIIKYRFFPTGSKDKPRFPTFCGFRDKIDL